MIANNLSPAITIVIPVRNEAPFIDRCLRSVFSSDPIPEGIEVLVVDGMSTDGTRQRLAEWCRTEGNMTVLDNPDGIAPTAMNIGIRAARGRWIIILGAHAEYPPNYFTLCLRTIRRTKADNVGGRMITLSSGDNLQGKLVRALTTHFFGVGNAGFRLGANEGPADTVVFSCCRREVFERIGLFDERLVRNQDYEFNRRLLRSGGSIWHNPEIQARYYNQGTLAGLFRQGFRTGEWNVWMWYVAPYSFAWRHAIPLLFTAAIITALVVAFIQITAGVTLLALIFVPYLALAALAALQQAFRYAAWMFPILPFLFFAYHLVYGAGGLWGLLLLLIRRAPVQSAPEPWPGAGTYRAWPKAKIVTQ